MSEVLAKFHWDCGRMGSLDGLFTTDTDALEAAYGKQVCFGEVLGKHSDIYGTLTAKDITIVSTDTKFIDQLREVIGSYYTISGFNPLEYLDGESDEEDEE